jgi:hypothetical protein
MTFVLRRSAAVGALALSGLAVARLEWWALALVAPALLLALVLDPE